jgi:hypothetical protein
LEDLLFSLPHSPSKNSANACAECHFLKWHRNSDSRIRPRRLRCTPCVRIAIDQYWPILRSVQSKYNFVPSAARPMEGQLTTHNDNSAQRFDWRHSTRRTQYAQTRRLPQSCILHLESVPVYVVLQNLNRILEWFSMHTIPELNWPSLQLLEVWVASDNMLDPDHGICVGVE